MQKKKKKLSGMETVKKNTFLTIYFKRSMNFIAKWKGKYIFLYWIVFISQELKHDAF